MTYKQFFSRANFYFGKLPRSWKWKSISEVKSEGKSLVSGPFGSNIGKKFFRDFGIPVIRGNNLKNNRFTDFGFVFVDAEKADELKNCVCISDDIIFTSAGTLGQVGIIPKSGNYSKYIISNKQLRLRVNLNMLIPLFAFYWFSSKKVQNYLINRNVGSALPLLTLRELKDIPVPIPPLSEQQRIVKILTGIDQKIQNLQNQNKILEQIAQSIFKSWFIDFEFPNKCGLPYGSTNGSMIYNKKLKKMIPNKWTSGKLEDILLNIKDNTNLDVGLKNRHYVPINKLSIKKIGLEKYLNSDFAKSSLIKFERNDILLGAMRVYFHRVNLAPFAGITRTTTFVLRTKYMEYHLFGLLLLNEDSTISYANQHSKGTTMPYAVWDNSLSDMDIIIPPNHIAKKFNDLLLPLTQKIQDSIFEFTTLTQIKDLLLPKLMSGKIRV